MSRLLSILGVAGWQHPCETIGWAVTRGDLELTTPEVSSPFKPLAQEVRAFLGQRGLWGSVNWLHMAAPKFFEGASLEVDLLPAEEGEDDLLALRVHGSFEAAEFRRRRHELCEAMRAAGHEGLYKLLGIFQRKVQGNGWQTFSWYSALSAE